MKASFGWVLVVSLAAAGCGQKQNAAPPAAPTASAATNAPAANSPAASTTNAPGQSALTAPVDYLGQVGNAKVKAIRTLDLASLNQAIQMFQVDEGRFPKSLDELIEHQLITRVPDAPYGMKIVYDPETGKVDVVEE